MEGRSPRSPESLRLWRVLPLRSLDLQVGLRHDVQQGHREEGEEAEQDYRRGAWANPARRPPHVQEALEIGFALIQGVHLGGQSSRQKGTE